MQPVSVTKVVGASVLLPCVVTSYPAPHVRWMFADKLVEERYEHLKLSPDIFGPFCHRFEMLPTNVTSYNSVL